MNKIRKSVFETNSSSTHAISYQLEDISMPKVDEEVDIKSLPLIFTVEYRFEDTIQHRIAILLLALMRMMYDIPIPVRRIGDEFTMEGGEGRLSVEIPDETESIMDTLNEHVVEFFDSLNLSFILNDLKSIGVKLTKDIAISIATNNPHPSKEELKVYGICLFRGSLKVLDFIEYDEEHSSCNIDKLRDYVFGKVKLKVGIFDEGEVWDW